jgi:recombination associated protein RdgC
MTHVLPKLTAATVFDYTATGPYDAEKLQVFTEPQPSERSSIGFLFQDGVGVALSDFFDLHGDLHHFIIQFADRILPKATINKRVAELAAQVEQQTGRKPGKKARKDLAEEAELELLPKAFIRYSAVTVTFDPSRASLIIWTASKSKCDKIITLLVASCEGLAVKSPTFSPSEINQTLAKIADFESDSEHFAPLGAGVWTQGEGPEKKTVRVKAVDASSSVVENLLNNGYKPTALEVMFGDESKGISEVTFCVNDNHQFTKINLGIDTEAQREDEVAAYLSTLHIACKTVTAAESAMLAEIDREEEGDL